MLYFPQSHRRTAESFKRDTKYREGTHDDSSSRRRPHRCRPLADAEFVRGGRACSDRQRRGKLSDLLQSRVPEIVQPRRVDSALVLVSGGAASLHRNHQGRTRLCDGLLGRRDEQLVPAVVSAECRNAEGGVGSGRESDGNVAENRTREGLRRRNRDLLPRQRQARPPHPRGCLREGDGAAAPALSGRPGSRRFLCAGAERGGAADRQDLRQPAQGRRNPRQSLEGAARASRRRALSDPQRRLGEIRRSGARRGDLLFEDRAGGAARAAHAVAHLHPAGAVAAVDRVRTARRTRRR